jgi:bifunctional DNase/RNase
VLEEWLMGDQDRERQAVTLLGVGMESTTGAMVMVLRETGEAGRALPIKIGPHEAYRIGLARDGNARRAR